MKIKKRVSIICFVLAITSLLTFSASALSPSNISDTATRNYIANSWTYETRGYYENNCLAWALNNTTDWIWPWGSSNPSVSEVDSYLANYGYTNQGVQIMSERIYAYGFGSSCVTHFARGFIGPVIYPIDAKWGHYEVFYSSNTTPYTNNVYGGQVASYS